MIVAAPLFGNSVAPRFGFADEFLIAHVSNNRVEKTEKIVISDQGWLNRLSKLKGMGVDVLICSGFNRVFFPLAKRMGIHVFTEFDGDAHTAIEKFTRERRETRIGEIYRE